MELVERVALVTGAASGIGRATAKWLSANGAVVALVDLDEEHLAEVAREIGGVSRTLVLPADVTDEAEVAAAVQATLDRWGRLDIVVANAGSNGTWAPIDELSLEDWRSTLDLNLTGSFITIKAAVPALKRQGGTVVVVGSVNGTRVFSNSGATAYASSKAGQVAMAKMLALELARHRVRVNAVCPGAILTPIHDKTRKQDLDRAREPVEFPEGKIPLTDGEPGDPEQVADLIGFLVSDRSAHVTGSVVYIDGGESLLQG